MPYLNTRLHALLAVGLLLIAAPALHAQEASVVSAQIRGDVNGDGQVTAADAEAVRAYLVRGTVPAGRSMLPAGDANADGRVTAADAALISRFAAGVDVSRFPVGRTVGSGGEGKRIDISGALMVEYECTISLTAGASNCRPVIDLNGARGNMIAGAPRVTFTQATEDFIPGTPSNTRVVRLTIHNDSVPVIGTLDGTTAVASQMFFKNSPAGQTSSDTTPAKKLGIAAIDALGPANFSSTDGITANGVYYYEVTKVIPQGDSASANATFVYDNRMTSFTYTLQIATKVPAPLGRVNMAPVVDSIISAGSFVQLSAAAQSAYGGPRTDVLKWESSDSSVAIPDGTGKVTGIAGGTATITARSITVPGRVPDTQVIRVFKANNEAFAPTVFGNVEISSLAFGVTQNDTLHGATPTVVVNGATVQGGTVDINADGTFSYDPPAGYEGPDSFNYTISRGSYNSTATVSLTVAGMIWFVDADAGACAPNCGRQSSPFNSLSAFNTANAAGGARDPKNGHPIIVDEGAYTGPVTLRNSQKLIGEDATGVIATLAGITLPAGSSLQASNTVATVTIAGDDGITLAQNNSLFGFTLQTTAVPGSIAIDGNNFGTLTLASGPGDVTIASSGQALALSNGNLSGAFASVGSTGGTNNVSLTSVTTTSTASLGTGVLSGASNDAFVISGQNGSFTYAGTISNAAARAVNVSGKSGGAVTLSGDINPAAAGGGISVSGLTGGTVTFNGAAKKISTSTAAAGVSVTGNTGATINFTGGGLTITTTSTGSAFTATGGGTVEVSGAGNKVSVTGAAAGGVNLNGIALAAGGMSFDSIASTGVPTASVVSATSVTGGSFSAGVLTVSGTTGGTSRGIALSSNSAPFTFATATINNTAAEGIFLNGNTAAVNVNGGSVGATTSTAGDALSITGGNAGVTVAATLTKTTGGRIANIASHTAGAVTVSGALSCTGTCTGILANANGGTVDFSNGTKTLTTAANAAVTLTSNTGTINFTNGGLVINTTSGAGFSASGGGTVNVEGTTNTVSSTTGTAVSINGTNIGGNGVRFLSVSANGAANGIFLNNTGATGGSFRVDGSGSVGSGGSILNTTGADGATSGSGVYLNNVRNVILSGMIINDHPNFGIFGQTVHGFTLDNSRLAGTHGTNVGFDEAVISITGLDGQAVFSNDSISGGIEDNVRILNHGIVSAASDSILFNNVRMGHVNSTSGNTALLVRVADGSTNRVRIRNSTFHGSRGGAMFHLNVVNTANARLALDANTFNNTQTQISGAGGVLITASGTAASVPTLTYNITGNTFRGSRTVALNINKDVGLAVINGNISGNVIGVAATANSGSVDGSGIQLRHQGGGTHRATVTNNQIFQYNNYGIILEAGDAVAGGGHGRMDMTVTGNTISNPGTLAFPWNGLHANIGTVTDDAHILCLVATGNSLDNSGTATQDIRLRQRMKTTIILPGYGGGASDNTAVNNFVKANNGNGANLFVVASNSVGVGSPNGPGNGFTNGSCNAPTL